MINASTQKAPRASTVTDVAAAELPSEISPVNSESYFMVRAIALDGSKCSWGLNGSTAPIPAATGTIVNIGFHDQVICPKEFKLARFTGDWVFHAWYT